MKNKIKILLVIIIVFFPIKISNSNEFELKSENIIVKENGNLIEAKGDVEVITNNNIEIMGENAKLNKEKSILEIFGNVILKDNDKDLEIKSQYMVNNKKNRLAKAEIKIPKETLLSPVPIKPYLNPSIM